MTTHVPRIDSRHPRPAPIEYAGQWVAWNRQRTEIVAHGPVMAVVHAAAVAAGHPNAILQRVRDPHASFIGAISKSNSTSRPPCTTC